MRAALRRGARDRPATSSSSSGSCSRASSSDADAAFLADLGLNCVRIPVNYRHFEDDASPFELKEDGFRHLDRAIERVRRARHLHDHRPARAARLAEPALALRQPDALGRCSGSTGTSRTGWSHLGRRSPTRYEATRGSPATTRSTSPPTESRAVVGPVLRAPRRRDPRDRPGAHPLPRRQHVLDRVRHLRRAAARTPSTPATTTRCRASSTAAVPGRHPGQYFDRALEEKFLERTEYMREHAARRSGSASSGPSTPATPRRRAALPDPRTTSSRSTTRYGAELVDLDVQGHRPAGAGHRRPDSPYLRADRRRSSRRRRGSASTRGARPTGRTARSPSRSRTCSSASPRTFHPYPWGRFASSDAGAPHPPAQPLAGEYAELFRGLGEDELIALADSFALERCVVREEPARAPGLAHRHGGGAGLTTAPGRYGRPVRRRLAQIAVLAAVSVAFAPAASALPAPPPPPGQIVATGIPYASNVTFDAHGGMWVTSGAPFAQPGDGVWYVAHFGARAGARHPRIADRAGPHVVPRPALRRLDAQQGHGDRGAATRGSTGVASRTAGSSSPPSRSAATRSAPLCPALRPGRDRAERGGWPRRRG